MSGHDGQLANPTAVRCSHAWQHTFARQSRQQEGVAGLDLIGRNLNCSGLPRFLDNIPYRSVIRKQRRHRLTILVAIAGWLESYPETGELFVMLKTNQPKPTTNLKHES
jgi:hypothetical protein